MNGADSRAIRSTARVGAKILSTLRTWRGAFGFATPREGQSNFALLNLQLDVFVEYFFAF